MVPCSIPIRVLAVIATKQDEIGAALSGVQHAEQRAALRQVTSTWIFMPAS
jgi:hypothetical protein